MTQVCRADIMSRTYPKLVNVSHHHKHELYTRALSCPAILADMDSFVRSNPQLLVKTGAVTVVASERALIIDV